jgi:HEPN domain-containing protein
MAKDYAERANWSLREAEEAIGGGNAAVCIRRTQEALELAAKAVLRKLGVEYPREHDVGEAVDVARERLPDELKLRVDEIKRLLTELAELRGPAFYGYEAKGIPASEAFTQEYATETLSRTGSIVRLCVAFASE